MAPNCCESPVPSISIGGVAPAIDGARTRTWLGLLLWDKCGGVDTFIVAIFSILGCFLESGLGESRNRQSS